MEGRQMTMKTKASHQGEENKKPSKMLQGEGRKRWKSRQLRVTRIMEKCALTMWKLTTRVTLMKERSYLVPGQGKVE